MLFHSQQFFIFFAVVFGLYWALPWKRARVWLLVAAEEFNAICMFHIFDPKVRQPDISRAKKVLGWEPRVNFEEGIKKTFEYFRKRVLALHRDS